LICDLKMYRIGLFQIYYETFGDSKNQ